MTAHPTSSATAARLDILETLGAGDACERWLRRINPGEVGNSELYARLSISAEDVKRLMALSAETLRERKARHAAEGRRDYTLKLQREWRREGRAGFAACEVIWAITGVWIA